MEQPASKADTEERVLREFVYLDEVSLRSLLSSLTGDLRDSASEQSSDDLQAEVAGAVKVGNALTGVEGNLSSRFQTSNSSTIQTSRKATVQSWFKQFHEMKGLRLIEVTRAKALAMDVDALLSTTDKSLLVASDELTRGALVEFRVRLSADPVYRLGTMVTEFSGMAEDYPDMFGQGAALESLREAQPVGKVLDRLLVGLVPIRAVAVDYSAVTVDGRRFVAHNDLLKELPLTRESVQIVGVTEQLGYWKDLRRVLFSEAEVTLLGRVSRAGLQPDWSPVKLADLFEQSAPGVVAQINAAGRLGTQFGREAPKAEDSRLSVALRHYAGAILDHRKVVLTDGEQTRLDEEISRHRDRADSVSEQHGAFAALRIFVAEQLGASVGARRELALRESARAASGLPLFPAMSGGQAVTRAPETVAPEAENLVDLEIIAIYW
ncbi:DUF6414 family protein [Microbacterium oxydans]|uniref:DUF6414 family protein n=1 Tax=Microbacterium oxydans TaxID=82380 RepID=UPI0005EC8C69|nr:hypothetical protein [Microbacterium oxydans]